MGGLLPLFGVQLYILRLLNTLQVYAMLICPHVLIFHNFSLTLHASHTLRCQMRFWPCSYGEGTYFSSDLSVCMGFNVAGQAWGRSVIGSRLSCIAVCDIVQHPSVTLPGGLVKRELVDANSVGGDRAPDTYVVVPNNDHIRVRYLFVYAEQPADRGSFTGRGCLGRVRAVVARHRFAASLLCYALILVVVGLWNTRAFRRWVARAWR